jgi:hypothetical protein
MTWLHAFFFVKITGFSICLPPCMSRNFCAIFFLFCFQKYKTSSSFEQKWLCKVRGISHNYALYLFQLSFWGKRLLMAWQHLVERGFLVGGFTISLSLTHTHTTVGRAPLGEWSVLCGDLYLRTHNTQDRDPCHQPDRNPQSQQANGQDPRLGPGGNWNTRL